MLTSSQCLAVGVGAADPAAGREDADGVAVGVPHARQQVIFLPVLRHEARFDWRQLGVVAGGDVDLAVGPEHDGVGAVFATTVDASNQLSIVELIVAVGIAEPIEALFLFGLHDIEAVVGVEESVSAAAGRLQRFDLSGRVRRADGWHGDSIK